MYIFIIDKVSGLAVYHHSFSCERSPAFASVAYASVAMTTCVIVLEVTIVVASSRGTIKNNHPRRFVPHLLHARLIVFVIEIIALIVKTILAVQPEELDIDIDHCPPLGTAVVIAKVVVAITWFLFFTVVVSIAIYLDPCHFYTSKLANSDIGGSGDDEGLPTAVLGTVLHHRWHTTRSVWENRFKLLFCFSGSDESRQAAYREVANIFAHLFHNSNLVLSDIAAGILLLQKHHLQHERNLSNAHESSSVTVNFGDADEKKLFSDAFHYLNFALGTYTWAIHIYMNPTCGFCEVLSRSSLCSCCSSCCCRRTAKHVRRNIHKDNGCNCGFAGFIAMTGINEMDIVYARFENALYRIPFVVCLDHENKSIVVAIRGTLSLQDIMTDLTATTRPLQLPDWPEFAVHRGMYDTAVWIKEYLDDEVLESAFEKAPRYRLVFTGHSLGSGVACILSILFKEKYPDLVCYCFSPTGSLLNAEAAMYTQSFVTSITLGQDLICRLNFNTARHFSRKIIDVLESSRKPKHRILFEGFLETLGICCGREMIFSDDSRSQLPETDSETDENLSSPLITCESNTFTFDAREEEEDPASSVVPPLYPPGRIIHIVDTSEERMCFFARRELEARWSAASNFNEISVSPYMLKDHFPDVLYRAMRLIWLEHKDDLESVEIE